MRQCEDSVEVVLDEPPHFLRPDEVVVDRGGAERVRAQQDPTTDFGAEVLAAGGGEEDVRFVSIGCGFVSVTDAVVFGEVGGGFGGGEDVVGGEGGFGCGKGGWVDGMAFSLE